MQKRNFVRVPFDGCAEISQMDTAGEMTEPCTARILDISAGGMCFESHLLLLPMEQIIVKIKDLPDLEDFTVSAITSRCIPLDALPDDEETLTPDYILESGAIDFNKLLTEIENLLNNAPPEKTSSKECPCIYRAACVFDIPDAGRRDKLVSSIFEIQRRNIRRKLVV